jgi:hypothetical protein
MGPKNRRFALVFRPLLAALEQRLKKQRERQVCA